MHQPWKAQLIGQSVEQLEAILPSFAWPNYVLGSHDAPRLASRVGEDQARIAAMLLLTLRGTPTLYYGDELGMENGIIPPEKLQDPQGLRLGAERTRDVGRTPMQWDSSAHAGFSSLEPWLPISADCRTLNVEAKLEDDTSILNLYRRLLWFRRKTPALQSGSYRTVENGQEDCFSYIREHPIGRYLVALNFGTQHQALSLKSGFGDLHGRIKISTSLDRTEKINFTNFSLRPNEGVLAEIL
jgi:alpha-glucosidase